MKLILLLAIVAGLPALAAPVSLEEAFSSAEKRSESLRQGAEQLSQADARIDQLTGGVFPNLSFQVNHTIQPTPSNPVAAQFSPAHQTTANFALSQPLFRGLREWNGLGQLRRMRSAHVASQEDAKARLYTDVAQNYLQILSFEQDLVNLKEQSGLYDARVKELTARVGRGESNRTDLVTAEATQATLLAELRVVEGQLTTARENFHFLTGLDPASSLADPEVLKATKLEKPETYVERIEVRPDVTAAREKLEAARKAVTVAWGGHWPTLDLTANYYLTRPGFLSDINWDVGFKLTVPLFEGFATQAKITEAASRGREAELELERLRRAARQDLRSLHSRVQARLNQLDSLKRSAELSRRNSDLLQRDYRRGLARSIDVQLALTEARATQRALDQARFASQLEMIQLQTAAALKPAPSSP